VEQSTRSTNRSIQNLAKSGIPGETIRESLISQSVELIFTAHPTQVLTLPPTSVDPWYCITSCDLPVRLILFLMDLQYREKFSRDVQYRER
jgi:hypothetical protein